MVIRKIRPGIGNRVIMPANTACIKSTNERIFSKNASKSDTETPNGRVFEKNVTKRMQKEANSRISGKNVTKCAMEKKTK